MLAMGMTVTAPPGWASAGHGNGTRFETGRSGQPGNVDRTVKVAARDMEFGKHQIDVHAGRTVRFVVTNTGKLRHEFVIGTRKELEEHAQEMADMTADKAHEHPNGILLKPGETKAIAWTFAECDDARFACLISGHYAAGMWGKFDIHG